MRLGEQLGLAGYKKRINRGTHCVGIAYSAVLAVVLCLAVLSAPVSAATVGIPANSETQIEAEDYVSAYDTTGGNAAGSPSSCTYNGFDVDVGDNGGSDCVIGYIANGETLTYDVNIAQAGSYTVKYNYASPSNSPGQIQFKVDGSTVTTTTLTTNTGDWNTYTTQTDTVTLPAGTHTVTTQFVNPVMNLSWFSLEKVGGPSAIDIPASGETQIGFEEYVSAYDTTVGNAAGSPALCVYNGFDVDVYDSGVGACALSSVADGETLDYYVNVIEAGDYTLTYNFAGEGTSPPGDVIFKVDGSTILTTTLTTTTGSFGTFASDTDTVTLSAGTQTITLEFSNPWLNANWFSLEKVAAPISPPSSDSIRIEAEEYFDAYDAEAENRATAPSNCVYGGYGVDVTDTSDEGGGGCKVGYVRAGERLDYAINPSHAGAYRVAIRYASGRDALTYAGDLLFTSGGSTLATVNLLGTGGWETFGDSTVVIDLEAGAQTLSAEFTDPNYDLNWFDLELKTVYILDDAEYRIEAEDYISANDTNFDNQATDNGAALTLCPYYYEGVDLGDTTDGGGCTVGYIADGEWLEYSVYIDEATDYTVKYRHASGTGGGGTGGDILFKVDGTTAQTTTITEVTGDWNVYADTTATVALTEGLHTIRLEFSNPYVNLNWFSLQKSEATSPASGSCSFPGVAANVSDVAQIIIHNGGTIHDAPNNEVVTKNINSDASGCGSGIPCTKTDTVAPAFTDIPAFPAGSDVTVAYGDTYNFTPGAFNNVNINSDTTLNFAPGDYTFNNNLNIGSGSVINVSSAGLVRIFVNSGFSAGSNVTLNAGGGATEFLFIYVLNDLTFQSGSSGKLIAYSGGSISLHNNADITGALTSNSNLTVQFGANLRYEQSYISSGGFSEACGGGGDPSGVASVGTWRFDDPLWNGAVGEVEDSSGNGLHAVTVNAGTQPTTATASPALSGDPGTCGYGVFDGSGYVSITDPGAGSVFDAPDYTIAGWYYPTSYPSSGEYYTLATKGSHYEVHMDDAGELVINWDNGSNWDTIFATGTLPLNTWTHVAYSYTNGEQKLYLNGVLETTATFSDGYLFNDSPLFVGYDSAPTTRGFRGNIEEFSFYDSALSASDVAAVAAATHSCPSTTRTAIAEWRFDDAGWDGTANEVVDSSGNNLHGTAVSVSGFPNTNTASPALAGDPGTCAYGAFDLGNNGYVTITDPGADSVLDVTELTFSAWVYPNAYPPSTLSTLITKNTHFEVHITTTGQVIFEWYADSDWQGVTTTATLPLSQWSHVAVTFEAGEQKIYIDGVLSTSDTNANALEPNDDPIAVGYDLNPTSRAFDGHLDEVRLYGAKLTASEISALAAETRACPALNTPDHIAISVGATASTCDPETVTFTVNNASSDPITDYTGTLTLSTSTGHGDWSKTGTASDAYGTLSAGASDSGAATYTFSASDNGTVTLHLDNGRTEGLTVTAVDSDAGATGTSSTVTYTTNSFSGFDSTGGTQIVGYPQVWEIRMQQQDPITGDCSINSEYSQAGVKVWLDRSAADPNGTAPTFVDSISGDSVSVPSSEPGSNNFNLTFVNGVANFTLNTTDSGMYSFHVADKTRSFADVDLVFESDVKTYGPFGYYVSVAGNPAATTGAGAAFQAAGEIFRVNVTAVAWQAADDLDDDKIPDGHDTAGNASRADLSNNPVIASMGQENPAETITLSSALLLPAGGTDSGLKDEDTLAALARTVDNFSGGSGYIERVYFDEVGIIEIKAEVTDGQYMGKNVAFTEKSQSYSNNVGRFTPANFTFASGELTAACQTGLDYSYMGQGFSGQFAISPQSSRGSSLQNYTGDFVKLTLGDFDFVARDINAATELSARLAGAATSLAWSGDGTVNASFALARGATPDGPYTTLSVGTDFDDSDGIGLASASKDLDSDGDASTDSAELDQTEVRFGRLRLGDALGPETALLNVPLLTEYWDSPSWLQNDDDSCTTIARSDISYPSGTINTEGNRTITVGGGTTEGSYASIVGDAVSFSGGDATHRFSAPGTGNTGNFKTSIDLTNYPWLRFDWNGDGDYSDTATPDNQINFGTYRGHDRMLYWREY